MTAEQETEEELAEVVEEGPAGLQAAPTGAFQLSPGMLGQMLDALPPLKIGPGVAIFGDHVLPVEDVGGGAPGVSATVKCEGFEGRACGKLLRLNLLTAHAKVCPGCGKKYTHLLVIAADDDDEIIGDVIEEVLAANGYEADEG